MYQHVLKVSQNQIYTEKYELVAFDITAADTVTQKMRFAKDEHAPASLEVRPPAPGHWTCVSRTHSACIYQKKPASTS